MDTKNMNISKNLSNSFNYLQSDLLSLSNLERISQNQPSHLQTSQCLNCHRYYILNQVFPPESISREYKFYPIPFQKSQQTLSIIKTIVSFLNTKGGTIYLGIKDDTWQVKGIQIKSFKYMDEFKLMIKDMVVERIYPKVDLDQKEEIKIEFVPIVQATKQGKYRPIQKYIVKILVKQGDPTSLYCLYSKNKQSQSFSAYKRHCLGGNQTQIKSLKVLHDQIRSKAKRPIPKVETFHQGCNPSPLLPGQIDFLNLTKNSHSSLKMSQSFSISSLHFRTQQVNNPELENIETHKLETSQTPYQTLDNAFDIFQDNNKEQKLQQCENQKFGDNDQIFLKKKYSQIEDQDYFEDDKIENLDEQTEISSEREQINQSTEQKPFTIISVYTHSYSILFENIQKHGSLLNYLDRCMPSRYSKNIIQQEDGSIRLQFQTKSSRDSYFNLCNNKVHPHKKQFNKFGKTQKIEIRCLDGNNSGNNMALKTINKEMKLNKKQIHTLVKVQLENKKAKISTTNKQKPKLNAKKYIAKQPTIILTSLLPKKSTTSNQSTQKIQKQRMI